MLAATTGANTDRYVQGPRGIHAQRDAANNWEWMVQDGLGSVRGVADNNAGMLWGTGYAAYGAPINGVGTAQAMYGFTGEPTDANGLVHLRARYYNPSLGIFPSLDPFEGMAGRPMSLNGYSWVEGNVPNAGDPSGMCLYGYIDRNGVCEPLPNRQCICSAQDLVQARQCAEPNETRLDVWLSQVKADCLLEGDGTSLERLARLSDFVAPAYANDRIEYMQIMSQVVIGSHAGTLAAVNSLRAGGCAGWGREPFDCPTSTLWLDDSGFHPDFQDGHNQVYHFWGMVASTGAIHNLPGSIITVGINVIGFQLVHEIVQGTLCNLGLPGGDKGASWQDYALTDMALALGLNISSQNVAPLEVGNWIRAHIGENGGWHLQDSIIGQALGIDSPNDFQEMFGLPGGKDAVCGSQFNKRVKLYNKCL